jgi:hypothetical protein
VTVGQTMKPADTETAIAMATGISGGAAHTIPSIFFNLSANGKLDPALADDAQCCGRDW